MVVGCTHYVCRYFADVDDVLKGRVTSTFDWHEFLSPEIIMELGEELGDKNVGGMCCWPDGVLFVKVVGEDEEIYLPYYDDSVIIVGMDVPAPCPGECIGEYDVHKNHLIIDKPDKGGNDLVWVGNDEVPLNLTRNLTTHEADRPEPDTSQKKLKRL